VATTFIDTNAIPRTRSVGTGEVAEILNDRLCGAKNVLGMLRWLGVGDRLDLKSDADSNHLVYLMEGAGTITLNGREHSVNKGAGIYLGPSESAQIAQTGATSLKLFHLVVPRIPKSA
jgi:mannose-6-phosphate isomerase-like protein (cupin superfamily)